MRMQASAFLLASIVSLAPGQADEQGPLGLVRGRVTEERTGIALNLSRIEVVEGDALDVCDSAGTFCAKMPPGEYTLRATYPTFSPETARVIVRENQVTQLDFRLGRSDPRIDDDSVRHFFDSVLHFPDGVEFTDLMRQRGDEAIAFNNRARVDAWRTFVLGSGSYALRVTKRTDLGDPYHRFLLVRDGRCFVVPSRGPYRWMRSGSKLSADEAVGMTLVRREWGEEAQRPVSVPCTTPLLHGQPVYPELHWPDSAPPTLFYGEEEPDVPPGQR
jgi:hypothetical protein